MVDEKPKRKRNKSGNIELPNKPKEVKVAKTIKKTVNVNSIVKKAQLKDLDNDTVETIVKGNIARKKLRKTLKKEIVLENGKEISIRGNTYINPLKLEKYRAQGLTIEEIAKIIGVSQSAIQLAINKWEIEKEETNYYLDNRAIIFAGFQHKILKILTEKLMDTSEIKRANLRDLALWFNSLYNNERLERNKSTSNLGIAGIIRTAHDKLFNSNELSSVTPSDDN